MICKRERRRLSLYLFLLHICLMLWFNIYELGIKDDYAILPIFLLCQMCIIKNMKENQNVTTGERLKFLRNKLGFTQIKVQMLTGIDQSDYSRLERGHRYPTVEQAKRLDFIYNTSMDYIFCLTDEEAPYPRKYRP